MNLEQIVKETVAKIVAEKGLTAAEEKKREEIVKAMKKDFKGPAPAMYAIATDKAKKLAEDGFFNSTDLNHQKAAIEISNFLLKNIPQYMSAQDAGKLLQYMGSELEKDNDWQQALSYYSKVVNEDKLNEDYEVAMAQDSLDAIIRATMMLKSQMGDKEVNLPAWIQDHITNAENYIYQAAKGYHESDAQMDDKAGAEEMNEEYDFVRSAIESASGDKISHTEEDDYGRTIYWSTKNPNVNYFVGMGGEFEGKIYLYNGETGERYPIGDLKHYGDGQNHAADDNMYESQDISDDELAQLQATADDTSKMPAERDAARNKIYASRAKKESQELEEFMIRRWQHYAGIK
jgi:hypothetical protein